MNEAKIMQKLVHPYLVKCLKTFQNDNMIYIVMEWYSRNDLRAYLEA